MDNLLEHIDIAEQLRWMRNAITIERLSDNPYAHRYMTALLEVPNIRERLTDREIVEMTLWLS